VNIYGSAGRQSVVSGTNSSSSSNSGGGGVVSNDNQRSAGCSNGVSYAQHNRGAGHAGQQQQQQQRQVPSQDFGNRSTSSVDRRGLPANHVSGPAATGINCDNNISGHSQQPTAQQESRQQQRVVLQPDFQENQQSRNGEPGSEFGMTSAGGAQNSAPFFAGASTSSGVTSDTLDERRSSQYIALLTALKLYFLCSILGSVFSSRNSCMLLYFSISYCSLHTILQ
jgi:hypothetical protein